MQRPYAAERFRKVVAHNVSRKRWSGAASEAQAAYLLNLLRPIVRAAWQRPDNSDLLTDPFVEYLAGELVCQLVPACEGHVEELSKAEASVLIDWARGYEDWGKRQWVLDEARALFDLAYDVGEVPDAREIEDAMAYGRAMQ